jgi:Mn-dependent DtxR family transcriptional regulator
MDTLNKDILVALFHAGSNDEAASVAWLARRLGVTRRRVACELDVLAEAGLIRAETIRLTFLGLTVAVQLAQKRARRAQRCAA